MQIIQKGWGCEKIVHNADGYCGKILCFGKGKRCSYHFHRLKTETFLCHKGKIQLRYGGSDDLADSQRIVLCEGDTFHVPVGLRHQMEALEDSELFEFSTTDFPEDSIRVVRGD